MTASTPANRDRPQTGVSQIQYLRPAASHVASAQAGVVSESPFVQQTFDQELYYALTTDQRAGWYKNGIEYGANPGLYRMPETVSDLIEERAATRARLRSYDRMIFPAPRH